MPTRQFLSGTFRKRIGASRACLTASRVIAGCLILRNQTFISTALSACLFGWRCSARSPHLATPSGPSSEPSYELVDELFVEPALEARPTLLDNRKPLRNANGISPEVIEVIG